MENHLGRSQELRMKLEAKYPDFLPEFKTFFKGKPDCDEDPMGCEEWERCEDVVEDVLLSDPRLHGILRRLATPIDQRLTDVRDQSEAEERKLLVQTFESLSLNSSWQEGLINDQRWHAVAKDLVDRDPDTVYFNGKGEQLDFEQLPPPDPFWVKVAEESIDHIPDEMAELDSIMTALLQRLPTRQRNKYLKNPEKYNTRYDPIG